MTKKNFFDPKKTMKYIPPPIPNRKEMHVYNSAHTVTPKKTSDTLWPSPLYNWLNGQPLPYNTTTPQKINFT